LDAVLNYLILLVAFLRLWEMLLNTLMLKEWTPFSYRNSFDEYGWKLSCFMVFMLLISEFKLYILLLSTTNNRNESMYYIGNGNIFKFLDTSLQWSLFLLPVIILIAPCCILKILVLSVEFSQNIIPYDITEWMWV
jgi:hypothetical protein